MKIVKMFAREDFPVELWEDIVSFLEEEIYNDSAIKWIVQNPNELTDEIETGERINEFLISQGANINEKVYIDLSW